MVKRLPGKRVSDKDDVFVGRHPFSDGIRGELSERHLGGIDLALADIKGIRTFT